MPCDISTLLLNVQERDATGREGLGGEGRNLSFLASLIHVGLCFVSRQRVLLVIITILKGHHSNGDFPPLLQRLAQSAPVDLQHTGT